MMNSIILINKEINTLTKKINELNDLKHKIQSECDHVTTHEDSDHQNTKLMRCKKCFKVSYK